MNYNAPDCVKMIISAYEPFFDLDPSDTASIGRTIPIPFFQEPVLQDLCTEMITFLQKWDALVPIRAPIYVIGDIHGNLFDLIRIFILCGRPPQSRFLFLGDYVDRGSYSTEVLTYLFALSLCYPGYVLMLRGNHEFSSINAVYGFKEEVTSIYDVDALYERFNEVFSWLPIAATVNDEILCVHGGLSPLLKSLADFSEFPRPLQACDHPVVSDLVWSDPSEETGGYVRSKRGSGVQFGEEALSDFLREHGLKKLIRAHQCVQLGIERFAGESLYTVFSCSNYVDASNNRCGIMFINADSEIQTFSLPPGFYCHRTESVTEPCVDKRRALVQNQKDRGAMSIHISVKELGLFARTARVGSQRAKWSTKMIMSSRLHVHTSSLSARGRLATVPNV